MGKTARGRVIRLARRCRMRGSGGASRSAGGLHGAGRPEAVMRALHLSRSARHRPCRAAGHHHRFGHGQHHRRAAERHRRACGGRRRGSAHDDDAGAELRAHLPGRRRPARQSSAEQGGALPGTGDRLTVLHPDGQTALYAIDVRSSSSTFADTLTLPPDGIYSVLPNPNGAETGTATFTLHDAPDVTAALAVGGAAPAPVPRSAVATRRRRRPLRRSARVAMRATAQ